MSAKKIAFLGCGNMVQALFPRWRELDPSAQFFMYTPSGARASELAAAMNGKQVKSLHDLPPCDAYVFGFKPQTLDSVFKDFKPTNPNAVGISLLAAVPFSRLQKVTGLKAQIRLMPNTPALVGEGMMGVIATEVNPSQQAYFDGVFEGLSRVIQVETEEALDQLTPYSGSGPAYYFELARIMTNDLKTRGFTPEDALTLVAQTMVGAGKMLLEAKEPPAKLRDNVTSKAGVTEAVLKSLHESNLEAILNKAIQAGHHRLKELKNATKSS